MITECVILANFAVGLAVGQQEGRSAAEAKENERIASVVRVLCLKKEDVCAAALAVHKGPGKRRFEPDR